MQIFKRLLSHVEESEATSLEGICMEASRHGMAGVEIVGRMAESEDTAPMKKKRLKGALKFTM